MMLFVMLLIGILSAGVLALAWSSWQTKRTLQSLLRRQESSKREAVTQQYSNDLTKQVSEIQQAMGGVVNDLRAMGNQVYHLNQLASAAMAPQEDGTPQIMIEIHQPQAGQPGEQPQMMTPEDMPPEMLEKFKTFQSIYVELCHGKVFPSQHSSSLN